MQARVVQKQLYNTRVVTHWRHLCAYLSNTWCKPNFESCPLSPDLFGIGNLCSLINSDSIIMAMSIARPCLGSTPVFPTLARNSFSLIKLSFSLDSCDHMLNFWEIWVSLYLAEVVLTLSKTFCSSLNRSSFGMMTMIRVSYGTKSTTAAWK